MMAQPRGGGHELVFLLIGTFRSIIDELHEHLVHEGFADTRPMHGFVLQAIGTDAVTITELGKRLGVSKQAAAKTVSQLEAQGLVHREPNPADARASNIRRTERGEALLQASAAFFDNREASWVSTLGEQRYEALLHDLAEIGGSGNIGDFVGWLQSR